MSKYVVIHSAFGDLCEPVAFVTATHCEQVYEKTNTISRPWWENEGVVKGAKEGYRSTSVDDIIVQFTDKGELVSVNVVDHTGYKEMPAEIEVMIYVADGHIRSFVTLTREAVERVAKEWFNNCNHIDLS